MSCIFKLEQSDFETLLGLSESARHSLLWILSQFNCNHNGTLDCQSASKFDQLSALPFHK